MRHVAGVALTASSTFVAIMALLVNSPALFYMGTGLIAMILACRLQSWLAVRGLRFERIAPPTAHVGELVTIEVVVWSEKKLRRPLVTIADDLPKKLLVQGRTPSLPVAPAYDLPIRTQYQFRPLKRGSYRWNGLNVLGTDALGLTLRTRHYDTELTEVLVMPTPIPLNVELPAGGSWGVSEAESGQTRGAGIEPRGIREFVHGDSLRHVHWRSTARTGRLLVKEFEAGTHSSAVFFIQDTARSEVGKGADTSLELVCGNVVYMAEKFLVQGSRVEFPQFDTAPSHGSQHERLNEVYEGVGRIEASNTRSLAEQVRAEASTLPQGAMVFVMCAVKEADLADAVRELAARGSVVVPLLYDAAEFDKARSKDSAATPSFAESLRLAGGKPIMVPRI